MASILVTGGTGTFGSALVPLLRKDGHDVRVLSRRSGPDRVVGDLRTGSGVAAAVAGAEVVVHAASDTRRLGRSDVAQTTTLLGALGAVRHLLYLSIVGVDRIPFGYYRRKLACEEAIEASGLPHTVVRATQFHQLLAMVLTVAERLPVAPLPLDFRFQPIAALDAATGVAELVDGPAQGRAPDLGGPEVLALEDLVATWRRLRGRPRRTLHLPLRGEVAHGYRVGLNTCPDRAVGKQPWGEFVASLS